MNMIELRVFDNESCDQLLSFSLEESNRQDYAKHIARHTPGFRRISTPLRLADIELTGFQPGEDAINSIQLWKSLKGINRRIGSDRRVWVTLCHCEFLAYSSMRWLGAAAVPSEGTIKTRFHFEGQSLQTRLRNSISRLWWGCELTYDGQATDPFGLTRQFWKRQDVLEGLLGRTYGTYPNVLKGFLKFLAINPSLTTQEVRMLAKALNAFGGVHVLPALSEDDIWEILETRAERF